jgi:hypothetical protein
LFRKKIEQGSSDDENLERPPSPKARRQRTKKGKTAQVYCVHRMHAQLCLVFEHGWDANPGIQEKYVRDLKRGGSKANSRYLSPNCPTALLHWFEQGLARGH